MQTIRIIGGVGPYSAKVSMMTSFGSRTGVSPLMRIVNVLRKREELKSNWTTSNGFVLQTKDDYLFNVKEE